MPTLRLSNANSGKSPTNLPQWEAVTICIYGKKYKYERMLNPLFGRGQGEAIMKQVLLNDTAQRMYVEDMMTFEAIAKQLDCSERTIRNWATTGFWDQKRKKFREFQESLHEDAREIATLLAQKIKTQLENGQEPSNTLLNSFTKIAASMVKMRDYEKAIQADDQTAASAEKAAKSQKNAAEIFKQTFGVDLTI